LILPLGEWFDQGGQIQVERELIFFSAATSVVLQRLPSTGPAINLKAGGLDDPTILPRWSAVVIDQRPSRCELAVPLPLAAAGAASQFRLQDR